MSGNSNVGSRQIYEAKDQVAPKDEDVKNRDRYKEGVPNSHFAQDSSGKMALENWE